jgi:hypothetical protein
VRSAHRDPALKSDRYCAYLETLVFQGDLISVVPKRHHKKSEQRIHGINQKPTLTIPLRFSFRATMPTGFSAGRVATLTITFVEKIYDEKKTQNTSYTSNPMSKSVDTFKLGSLTNAMNATQSAIPIASIKSQCPVRTQMHTTVTDNVKLNISAAVNRPHTPKDIRFPSVQRIIFTIY